MTGKVLKLGIKLTFAGDSNVVCWKTYFLVSWMVSPTIDLHDSFEDFLAASWLLSGIPFESLMILTKDPSM